MSDGKSNDGSSELVSKLYSRILKIAYVTHKVLDKGTSAAMLAQHDPSFEELATLCNSLIIDIRSYQESNTDVNAELELDSSEEFLGFLNQIVFAIEKNDNEMLDDCNIEIDEYFNIYPRKKCAELV